jgi:hypothetical protein
MIKPVWEKQIGDAKIEQYLCEHNGSITLFTSATVMVPLYRCAEVNCF